MAPAKIRPIYALVALLTPFFTHFTVAQIPLSPTVDPFYQPPAGYQSSPPGTVLRSRTVTAAFLGLIPDFVEVHQLLYSTTSVNGTAIATANTIFKPANALTDKFVSFQTAEDSSALKCAPSYNYQLFANQTNLIVSVEFLLIQAYLGSGYIVVSPDYEGPDAAFGPGHLEGRGVLDSMRAVNNFAPNLGLASKNNSIVGSGFSGGAIATGWAAALQPTYAPELKIKGWAAGGTPANLTGTTVFLDNTTFSGFLPAALDGLAKPSAYGAQLTPIINEYITPSGRQHLDFANANCATDDIANFAGQSILTYNFSTLGPHILYEPTVAAVLQQQTLGVNKSETPTAPVFMYHATLDEIIPYANASTLYQDWCANGASVHFTTFAAGGHLTTEIFGLVPTIQFVEAAFAGTVASGCSQSTVANPAVDPLALGLDVEPVLIQLTNALLLLGQDDSNISSNPSLLRTTVRNQ